MKQKHKKVTRKKILQYKKIIEDVENSKNYSFELEAIEWIIELSGILKAKASLIDDSARKKLEKFLEEKVNYEKTNNIPNYSGFMFTYFGCLEIPARTNTEDYVTYINSLQNITYSQTFAEVDEYLNQEIMLGELPKIKKQFKHKDFGIKLIKICQELNLFEDKK